MDSGLTIGKVAKETGLTTKTIRYYELLGLLPKPPRTYSGYRLYARNDVERLSFIKKAKNLGFSLTDIEEILAIHDAQEAPCVHVLALMDRKIKEIGQLVKELDEFQKELSHLREESAARVEQGIKEGAICSIVDRGIHAKGQQALTWLESQRKG